ncbi:MAG TPA: cell division topological specificity factor MinE [Candidatus Competibacteraceae bacterium]|nr:cell division topological specificity factor MinE [Candidatus Competibacteraceae bacterium]
MGFFDYFRSTRTQNTAALAKERLQIIVAHERSRNKRSPDYLPALKKELLEVVRKYVPIDQDQVKVHLDREGQYEVLELNITLPDEAVARR